jgi:multiple sugar transport system permease protein
VIGDLTWQRRLLGLWLPLAALTVFCLFPFVWMVVTSLKPNAELYDPKAFPLAIHHPSLEHYIALLKETNFILWIANTMLVAVISTAISLVLGAMLAYPLARLRFPGAALLAMAVGAAYLVPQTLLFVPMVELINRLDLGNTLSAVMLTYPTLLVPFSAWLLMGYFKTVPKELEEAALIDGASRWRAMTSVILPLCVPGFISAGIFAFTLAQNEFLYALLFLTRSNIRTVSIGVVGELIRGDAFYWGQLMAAAFLGLIPVVLIYMFFVKYYVAGLTAGSVKG